MPSDYDVLASIYSTLGMNTFATGGTKAIFDFAQRNEWMGRQIVDLGCGTGESLLWLAQRGYVVSGIDQSKAMLDIARQNFSKAELNLSASQQDIRSFTNVSNVDMVLALDVIHELDSVRDLETVFKNVHEALKTDKLFVFDIYTIEGLFAMQQPAEKLVFEDKSQMIYLQNLFDYDRQVLTQRYIIMRAQANFWVKSEARRILRSYPVQAITGLLQRYNFEVQHVLNMALQKHDPSKNGTNRVIIIAQKR
jgi:SAM-dependent methyltransferase